MSYADAINFALKANLDQLRDYGGFLAQADMELPGLGEFPPEDRRYIVEGYARQLADFPNG